MLKRAFSTAVPFILIMAMAVFLSSCLSPSDLIPQKTVTRAEAENGIFSLVNEERQKAGLDELARDPILDTLARHYADNRFSESADLSSDIRYLLCNSWWATYGDDSPELFEDTAREQVDYCMENHELRQAMFRIDARATGVGISIVGDTVYYAQVFDVLNAMCGDGEPVVLYENDYAADPSWEQLKQFVVNDATDEQPYIADSFVCADFAAMLHNRAEAAGIRTAYVSVEFTDGPGHALNAFNTTDQGLIYIDCTGQGMNVATSTGIDDIRQEPVSYDKVAYLSTGHEYGLLSLDKAYSFDYAFYEQWMLQWEAYQAKVVIYQQKGDAYEEAVGGRTVIADPDEYATLKTMYEELQTLREELKAQEDILGTFHWEPLGTVSDFYIHW